MKLAISLPQKIYKLEILQLSTCLWISYSLYKSNSLNVLEVIAATAGPSILIRWAILCIYSFATETFTSIFLLCLKNLPCEIGNSPIFNLSLLLNAHSKLFFKISKIPRALPDVPGSNSNIASISLRMFCVITLCGTCNSNYIIC